MNRNCENEFWKKRGFIESISQEESERRLKTLNEKKV